MLIISSVNFFPLLLMYDLIFQEKKYFFCCFNNDIHRLKYIISKIYSKKYNIIKKNKAKIHNQL